ncbi:MAG: alpha-glucan family phosphorylase, partial [Nitriliruptoraceae bacterium]
MDDVTTLRSQLERLARNLRWFADRPTRELFADLGARLEGVDGRDPMAVLHGLDAQEVAALSADPAWRERIDQLAAALEGELAGAPDLGGDTRLVAYLSAEFALCDPLHTYSGGLGVLAGDHLRSASDLAIPLVAVGLAYRDGYFTQTVDAQGNQEAAPAPNDLERSAAEPVVDRAGERLTVTVPMGDGEVTVQAWRVAVGRVPLVLLDTDVASNAAHHRAITRHLYGGDKDTRIRQELILGVGGVRMLDAMGLHPDLYHLNEGHAAFAGLERLGVHRRAGKDVDAAIAAVREELQFTTHTPVPAGHDTFDHGLAAHHLGPLCDQIGIGFDGLWKLATGAGFPTWNQTVLALKLASRTNGVARLHGEVSRAMFASLWPDRPVDEVPIDHVTNGVHPTSWTGPEIAALLDEHVPGWRRGTDPEAWQALRAVDRSVLWQARTAARARLLEG